MVGYHGWGLWLSMWFWFLGEFCHEFRWVKNVFQVSLKTDISFFFFFFGGCYSLYLNGFCFCCKALCAVCWKSFTNIGNIIISIIIMIIVIYMSDFDHTENVSKRC